MEIILKFIKWLKNVWLKQPNSSNKVHIVSVYLVTIWRKWFSFGFWTRLKEVLKRTQLEISNLSTAAPMCIESSTSHLLKVLDIFYEILPGKVQWETYHIPLYIHTTELPWIYVSTYDFKWRFFLYTMNLLMKFKELVTLELFFTFWSKKYKSWNRTIISCWKKRSLISQTVRALADMHK